jgi:hypothetical protein
MFFQSTTKGGETYPRQEGEMHYRKRDCSRVHRPSGRPRLRSPITRNTAGDTPDPRSSHKHKPRRKAFLPNTSDCGRRHAGIGERVEEDVFAVGVYECAGGGDEADEREGREEGGDCEG